MLILLSASVSRTPTLGAWGGTALIGLVYFADWRVVLRKIPFVRGRFPPLPVESSGVVGDEGDSGGEE